MMSKPRSTDESPKPHSAEESAKRRSTGEAARRHSTDEAAERRSTEEAAKGSSAGESTSRSSENTESTDPAEFYRETVLRHSVEPVGYRKAIEATHEAERFNPLCGDRVTLKFRVDAGRIEDAAFEGEACAICLASASLLCAHAPGMEAVGLTTTGERLKTLLDGEEAENVSADLRSLAGVRRYPSRIRCALLPWEAAEKALWEG